MTMHVRGLETLRGAVNSLSGRLLAMTCLFVLVSELLILPSLVGHRHCELVENRIRAAESAILPFSETEWRILPIARRRTLLDRLDADSVILYHADFKELYPVSGRKPPIDHTVDLSSRGIFGSMSDGLDCLLFGSRRAVMIESATLIKGAKRIAVTLDETSIRAALVDYVMNVCVFGLAILVLTAAFMYARLYGMLVAPMRRIIVSMASFRENPADARRIIAVTGAMGEIGQAERELSAMQRDLYAYLQQTARLAALGAAVARIQHDLRNILATAQLNSDRLSASDDPAVKKLAPNLIAAIDRANILAGSTLKYVRSQEHPPKPDRFAVSPLIDEILQTVAFDGATRVDVAVSPDLCAFADREQAFRILLNLIRNAAQALASRADGAIVVSACAANTAVEIDIADNGPGIPDGVRARLFQPFALSSDKGSGLGLAIARELARSNGGEVALVATGTEGTRFRITLPVIST